MRLKTGGTQISYRNLIKVLLILLTIQFYQTSLYSQQLRAEEPDTTLNVRGPRQIYSLRAGTAFNGKTFYLCGEISYNIERITNIKAVLEFCFTPLEKKILKYESKDVYLNLTESRYIGILSLEKTFWFNNTLGFYISAGLGWVWLSYAGTIKDDSEPLGPVFSTGLDINLSENIETGSAYGLRIGYEFLNSKSKTDNLVYLSFIYLF